MQVKELLTDDDAVSPVIGVILMVAITVILAAVIAAFVLGLGDTSNPGPQVSFDYDYDSGNNNLEITVSSGDTFEASRVTFEGSGIDSAGSSWDEANKNGSGSFTASSVIGAGDAVELTSVQSDFELDVVFTSEDGGDSNIISTRTGPDA
jgi:archaeal flagellin N-terminal-like domain